MSIRRRKGKVEAATHTYVKDGRYVVLFGVSHVAGHEFWKKANGFLAELEAKGFDVHFEGVTNDTNISKITPDYKLMADMVGLQDQRTGLKYHKHWKRTDTTLSELLSKSTPEQVAKAQRKAEETDELFAKIAADKEYEKVAKLMLGIMHCMPYFAPVVKAAGTLFSASVVAGVSRKSLIDDRNQFAVDAALSTDRHVVAVWGALHLPGIGKSLRENGFKQVSTQWHPAF